MEGNIRKMKSSVDSDGNVSYKLPLFENLEPAGEVDVNALIGSEISMRYDGVINCVVTGKRIRKAYGEGMSYDAFMTSPLSCPSIIKPELSRIHEGVALRDEAWEREHHLAPHYVYLSKTSGIKVGVTRHSQIPTRWVDQGAVEGVLIAETPYRQAAGLIEVALKDYIADKTNWRRMLKNELVDASILEKRDEIIDKIPAEMAEFIIKDGGLHNFSFPVEQYPEKVTSMKLDKVPIIEKRLVGVKGQYWIFDDNTVMNLRSHAGYRIAIN